jgi:predicted nuclease with RNAse H fold
MQQSSEVAQDAPLMFLQMRHWRKAEGLIFLNLLRLLSVHIHVASLLRGLDHTLNPASICLPSQGVDSVTPH